MGTLAKTVSAEAAALAENFLKIATTTIDRRHGSGYAAKHPELVGHFRQTAALIYAANVHARLMEELCLTYSTIQGR
jgi:hypothetical protein